MNDLRSLINATMARHNITQSQLAEATGIAQGNISRWLSGARESVTTTTADTIIAGIEQIAGRKLVFIARS